MVQSILEITIIITLIYMCVCFATDMKDKYVFTFPAIILAIAWFEAGPKMFEGGREINIAIVINIIVYLLLRVIKVWGDGDSDIFILFAAVYGTYYLSLGIDFGVLGFVMGEMGCLLASLVLSLLLGLAEAWSKKEKISGDTRIAVVPGFCITVIAMSFYVLSVG